MGQMILASLDNCSTIAIEWNDKNNRVIRAHIDNQCGHDVAIQLFDETQTLLFENVYTPGQYSQNLPGAASRYVNIVEIAPGDFEIDLNGFGLIVRG